MFRPDSGAIFGFLAVTASRNSKRLIENLKYASLLLLLYSGYQFIKAVSDGYWTVLNAAGESIEQSYNLGFGYTVIFCATIFFGLFIREKRKIYLILGCISTVLALTGGSRGCIVCLLVFGILYLFKEFSVVPIHKKIMITAAAVLLGILFNAFYYDILSGLSGIDARTIQMFLSGDITSDNGRDAIYSLASEAIKNMPFLGYGAFGDRQFITPYYYWGYCHNIFLEMIIDFGWLLGIIVFLIIGIKSIQVLISARDEQAFVICILLSANAKLFLSDTFWGYPQFWMLIAYLFFVFKEERKKYTEDKNG
ncbi:O-antigen ligase [uncultured Clostridium sp.]|uniref:O-antigen ligase family protein n=1 Tax=uncultured Clostridium sp. TaxID=59620 RepID=UPI0025DFE90D|nr:O-antigen ligase family protein [uncultured Clostridium sp.]